MSEEEVKEIGRLTFLTYCKFANHFPEFKIKLKSMKKILKQKRCVRKHLTLFVQGGVIYDPPPLEFLCSHFNFVKDRDFLLSDFSSG